MKLNDKIIKSKKLYFVIALLLLLLSHIVMGVILITMSKNALRKQIDQRMLDVANTAAYQLNGDELKTLTPDDIGTEKYNRAFEILRSFQKNIQLDYIYAVRAEGDGTFSFALDPDEDKPGEFGQKIETTDALKNAANGTPDVDKTAYTDSWGRFYSAYSPVFDSDGNVAGIVGVDFDADWYDGELNSHKAVVLILTMIVLSMAFALAFISHTFVLEGEKNEYQKKLEETLQREQQQEQELGSARYLAYTDPMTGVKSKHAYLEEVEKIDKEISEGTIKEFGVIVCDLNGLKMINDTFGHEEGDNYIKKGCSLICHKFCHSPVFRIGGDEFVVLLEGTDYTDRDELLWEFERQIDENQENGLVVVSTGISVFEQDSDTNFSAVFERADKKMYARKRYLKTIKALAVDKSNLMNRSE